MAHEWKRHVVTDDGAERAVQNIITHIEVLLTDEQKAEINWHPDQSVSLAIMRIINLLDGRI